MQFLTNHVLTYNAGNNCQFTLNVNAMQINEQVSVVFDNRHEIRHVDSKATVQQYTGHSESAVHAKD